MARTLEDCVRVLILLRHAPLHAMPRNTHLAASCTAGSCPSPPAPQSARRSRRHARRPRHRKVDKQPCPAARLLGGCKANCFLGREQEVGLSATLCGSVCGVAQRCYATAGERWLPGVVAQGAFEGARLCNRHRRINLWELGKGEVQA